MKKAWDLKVFEKKLINLKLLQILVSYITASKLDKKLDKIIEKHRLMCTIRGPRVVMSGQSAVINIVFCL